MKIMLSPVEARIVGCLLEKQVTTPDQYPMSLNGVLIACNQKSNREPVLSLSEREVQACLDLLVKKHLLSLQSGLGNRVAKYEQRFCNSTFGDLKLNPAEVAVVATLLLRGAQTPGELRARCSRMYAFTAMTEIEQVLADLGQRDDGPFVVQLAREPGKRENRYRHLFMGDVNEDQPLPLVAAPHSDDLFTRVAELETAVAELKQQLTLLRAEKNLPV